MRYVGKKYDWLAYPSLLAIGLLGFAGITVRRNPIHSRDRWFCSELVMRIFRDIDEDLLPSAEMSAVTPQKLANAHWGSVC